ncbi:hypothetical protein [Leptospira saintgironsiae]|uniref:hypothetical protein n=1 Tax=Leptospira saintgironsiae TaxID=2023183 RepID=UPI0013FE336B|nr:hypothetical protein [Leptospira saintgironsiae]
MAQKGNLSFVKRQREIKKKEIRQEKLEKRKIRNEEKKSNNSEQDLSLEKEE